MVMKNQLNLNDLSENCKNNNKLFNLLIVLLSACNQNCIHCYIPDHNSKGLSAEIVKKSIKEARELGALNVTLTGGEIFLREDIMDLILYARECYMRVFLMSNASLLTEEIIKQLKMLGIAEFSTTLFSMKESIHDAITQRKGSQRKTIENIMLLKKYGIPVTIKIPLMEENKYEYRDVEHFADLNNFNFMSTTTIFTKSNGDNSPHDLKITNDLHIILNETRELQKKYRKEDISYNKVGIPCGAGFNSIAINYDGMIWPCNSLMLNLGNVYKNNLIEIWKDSNNLKEWRDKSILQIKACEKCKLTKKCLRCPGMALLEDGDLYGCSSSAKQIAKLL